MCIPNWIPKAEPCWKKLLEGRIGVDCAQFDSHTHHHAMMVRYDPDAIEGMQILNMVRTTDPAAAIVGL